MLEAYDSLLQQLDEVLAAKAAPADEVKNKEQQKVLTIAENMTVKAAIQGMSDLKLAVGKGLSELSEKLEAEISKLESIRQAIAIQEKELAEVYEIRKSANSLAALLEAQNQKRVEFDREMQERKTRLEGDIQEQHQRWELEKTKTETSWREVVEAERVSRERDQAEFEYRIKRDRQLMVDELADEKRKLVKEITEKRTSFEKEIADREADLKLREAHLKELEQQAAGFDARLESAVQQAREKTANKVKAEYESQLALQEREHAGIKQVLETRIIALEETNREQVKRIEKLASQLDASYQKVQDVALKAIEGTSLERQSYRDVRTSEPSRGKEGKE